MRTGPVTHTHSSAEDDGKRTVNLFDAHGVLMQLVLQDQLLQVVERLLVDRLKGKHTMLNNLTKTQKYFNKTKNDTV